MIYALGGILPFLAGLVSFSFITWRVFCYAMARLPNRGVLVGQAPQIIKAFDIKSWGDVLLPWRIIERGIRGVTLPVARDADGAGGAQQGPQPETTTGTANQGEPPQPSAGP